MAGGFSGDANEGMLWGRPGTDEGEMVKAAYVHVGNQSCNPTLPPFPSFLLTLLLSFHILLSAYSL